jgi:hypothetical protein
VCKLSRSATFCRAFSRGSPPDYDHASNPAETTHFSDVRTKPKAADCGSFFILCSMERWFD